MTQSSAGARGSPATTGRDRTALGAIARSGNLSELAGKTGMSREVLSKALASDDNPGFSTISKVARALGLRIEFHAVA